MDYILTTDRLCKNYKRFRALDELSMHVPKGAIYGFVGKNGAGKTTLIRLICGLQKPPGIFRRFCGFLQHFCRFLSGGALWQS